MDDQTEVPPERCTETEDLSGTGQRCIQTAGHFGSHLAGGLVWGNDQAEVPPARDAEFCNEPDEDGGGCLNRPGHDGPHRNRNRMWGELTTRCRRTHRQGGRCVLNAGHEDVHNDGLLLWDEDAPLRPQCAERGVLGGRCRKDAGHTGAHNDGDRLWGPSEPEVSWPPAEWRAPASVTAPRDLTARLDALERTVEHQRDRISHLAARLDALEGAATTATEALRQHISEQASFTRRHVSVVLGAHVVRIKELLGEPAQEKPERTAVCDGVLLSPDSETLAECSLAPGHDGRHHGTHFGDRGPIGWDRTEPAQDEPEEAAVGPCPATAQSPTGLVSCTLGEGHTGSHMNALAVWSDAPPVPPGGVYQVY